MCKLQKSLYELKEASRNWYHKFTTALLAIGFCQYEADHSLFLFHQKTSLIVVLIYMDDVIVIGTDLEHIVKLKQDLHKQF